MGGNGAYIPSEGGVPINRRTHSDTAYRIDGHKVLVQSRHPMQNNTPVNSNSENPIYLCGKTDKDGIVTINTVAIYRKHRLVMTIDIKFDADGDIIPFANGGKRTTHAHLWPSVGGGEVGRRPHNPKNSLPYGYEYESLLRKIVEFNKERKIWKR